MNRKVFHNMIAYEIYPTSFYDSDHDGIGDLNGIRKKLDHIKEMGFNTIWLNPFYVSPFKDGGYDVKDFFDVDPKFGTLKDFEKLITKAHQMDLKIIIDLVAGHSSYENPDFLKSASAQKNEYSDLFIWNDNPWQKGPNLISGMFDRHGCYMVNFFAHQPAFNYGFNRIDEPDWQMSYKDPRTFQAREYLLKVMRFWLGKGADGFRVDMADSLVKNDDDKSATIEVWKYLFKKIRKEYPKAFFVSEWSDPGRSFEAGFDADFVLDHWDNFYHRFFRSDASSRGTSIIHGGNDVAFALEDLKDRFAKAKDHKANLSLISGNHDSKRIADHLNDKELRVFYLFLFTMPGIPFLLYGDELGMRSPELPGKDGGYQRTGTRIPMIWNDREPYHGFSDHEPYLPFSDLNTVSLVKAKKDEDSLYHFICRLTKLRTRINDLKDPDLEVDEKNRVFRFKRGRYELILNLSEKDCEFKGEAIISTSGIDTRLPAGEAMLVKKG